MREIGRVDFATNGAAADRRFIEAYLSDAVSRLPETPGCDRIGYAPQGHVLTDEGGVLLFLDGDLGALVELERGKWDALVDDGLLLDWEVTDVTERFSKTFGERGGELYLRLHHCASLMSEIVFDEFRTPPAAVDAYPAESSKATIGWWAILHLLTVHQGYPLEDELDAYAHGLEHTLDNIAEFEGPDRAADTIDELVETLETRRDTITNGESLEQEDTG